MNERALLCITTLPDEQTGMGIAHALVEERLAACVNVLSEGRSIYRWNGVVEEARERICLIKTTAARYPELAQRLAALHPYEVPELIVCDVASGNEPYLRWLVEQVS